jgi:amino acid adenylation domain-containing protein
MLVHQLLEQSARRTPDAVAVIAGSRTASFGQLDRLATRIASLLVDAGVRRHDRVVVAIENSVEFVAAYFGAMKAGAVAVPLPAGRRSDRLARAIRDSAPSAALIDASTAEDAEARDALVGLKALFIAGRLKPGLALPQGAEALAAALPRGREAGAGVRSIDVDLAAIIYTSGSTGEPRGVMLSHRNIVANTRSIVEYLALTARDRVMCVLPFYYVYGLSLLHTHVAVGGAVVLENRFVFPNMVLKAMRDHEVTGLAGVPSTFALLLHRSDLEGTPLPSLRYVTQAGGGMPVAQVQEWVRRGPQAPFYVMYGATEASARLTYLDPSRLADKLGSIGRPIPNVEILVVRQDGTIAGPGEVGELVARGSNVACGYWNNRQETADKFGPLGYRTGDLGYADEEGFLFLVGRAHDMLKVGAHRVGPREIEDVLTAYPGVLEAAVVGGPHALLGEVPVAFVALRDGAAPDAEALLGFCRSRLAPHKVPAHIAFLPALPKIPGIGKIDKRALRHSGQALGAS